MLGRRWVGKGWERFGSGFGPLSLFLLAVHLMYYLEVGVACNSSLVELCVTCRVCLVSQLTLDGATLCV